MLVPLLEALSAARVGPGRPRTRPRVPRSDKAHSSRTTRALLRRRGITAVIPEPRDQQQRRRHRGSRRGRPVALGQDAYRGHSDVAQRRAPAVRYGKLALTNRAGAVLRAVNQWFKYPLQRHARGRAPRPRAASGLTSADISEPRPGQGASPRGKRPV